MQLMYSLLLLSSLLHITTCTVYTVTPDDHYYPNTTCHHCHNLQHYLLNITKYFTSNTQLLFLPGLHHLHTDLIIQNVHNISLIGSTANGTTIIFNSLSTILIVNISKLTICNFTIVASHKSKIHWIHRWIPLTIKDCSFVLLNQLQIYQPKKFQIIEITLVAINIMGNSYFSFVQCYYGDFRIKLFYNETHTDRKHNNISINDCTVKTIDVVMIQNSYRVTLRIINIQLQHEIYEYTSFILGTELGTNKLFIIDCRFVSNIYVKKLFTFSSTSNGSVQFTNCKFINNNIIHTHGDEYLHHIYFKMRVSSGVLIQLYSGVNIEFNNCDFHDNSEEQILSQTAVKNLSQTYVIIKNTNFTGVTGPRLFNNNFISLSHAKLIFIGSVNINNIATFFFIISLMGNSTITISGIVNFSHNHVPMLINFCGKKVKYIIIKENSLLNIDNNEIRSFFDTNVPTTKYIYPFCLFQYFASSTVKEVILMEKRNFLIRFNNNHCNNTNCYNIPAINCLWLENSLFDNNIFIPHEVNNHYIQFVNNSGTYNLSQIIEQRSLCVCTNELHHDCHVNDLGYLYPGQTLTISLYHKGNNANFVAIKTDITQQYVTPCIVLDISENLQMIDQQCTRLHYTIGFPTDNWCKLFLKIASESDQYLNIFYVRQTTCPTGFVKIDKRCQCDPALVQYGITYCNITDQTILRPANSWISATTHNNSYTYHISLHCPFHYCLPHSSHHNFSTPNSQCQFNRSGILCGHCRQGLSTAFSSAYCQHCSNIYLLLTIPIAVGGLVLVLLLFILNLTVTDGTINGFIFYANIISINTPLIFTRLNHFTPTYTFISIANLDLGIQTCFYNGMDDYAKMWLQLAFPFYLIFIATLIIITSRYSTTIQRLTTRRALPVLATLFLLSYTKILRIVSSVLFFYSTIIHLPSKHTTLVWSVDANVPLFGVRFTILFIVCLILFLILAPFNVILLFTRTLSRFTFINKFKPLLDAYQGPYKDKLYNWIGLQLLLRAVFFGISSLDRNINIAISILLLTVITAYHGVMRPFKIKHKNHQELLLFFNLQGLYVSLLYSQDNASMTAVNIAITSAAVQFSFIIVYHMITYVYGGVIRNKIQLSINTLTGWITRLHKKSQPQHFQLQDNIRDNIPEVAFNYREYREPLVGVDC